jgi:hypothetical protein
MSGMETIACHRDNRRESMVGDIVKCNATHCNAVHALLSYGSYPFKVDYSGPLPVQPRSNRTVLRTVRNTTERPIGLGISAHSRSLGQPCERETTSSACAAKRAAGLGAHCGAAELLQV